jgi:nicotinamidase/pyrazinamidase
VNQAATADALDASHIQHVIFKGTNPEIDSYSGFFDNGHRQATGLHDYLQERGVTDLYLVGLATDYCVLYTAMDACQLGYHIHIITDGCRGLNVFPSDVERAFAMMRASGAELITSADILRKAA